MVKRIYKQAVIVVLIAAALSSFIDWKVWPLSIAIGGLLGLINLKAMVWGVEGLVGTHRASGALVFFSMVRLFLMIMIIAGLLVLKLVTIFGILAGFTIIFILTLRVGFVYTKEQS